MSVFVYKKLNDLYTFQLSIFMYQTKHDLIPRTCTYATLNNDPCLYNLRKWRDFTSARFRTTTHEKHVTHAGNYAWEALPMFVKQSSSLQIFKARLHLCFLSHYK